MTAHSRALRECAVIDAYCVLGGSRNQVFKGAQIWGAKGDQNQDLVRHDTISVCLFEILFQILYYPFWVQSSSLAIFNPTK
jgi:hypothetical protein